MFSITYRARGKAKQHSFHVYPLEAYGFLVGPDEFVCAALPVGKTQRWNEYGDRFARIEFAVPALDELLHEYGFKLHGLYHSLADSGTGEPYESTPVMFLHLPVYDVPVIGAETFWGHSLHQRSEKGVWQAIPYQKLRRPGQLERLNPRRILATWRRLWSEFDYSNNHKTELVRLYGTSETVASKDSSEVTPAPSLEDRC